MPRALLALLLPAVLVPAAQTADPPPKRNFPYVELEGTVEEFQFIRQWRSYYWREDFTVLLRDSAGKLHRVISREPTPWAGYRCGTTYTGLPVDWTSKPTVRVIGVGAVDRIPAEFHDRKLDESTVTAFILRVRTDKGEWRDFYVNNWFHDWGPETDRKVLAHYATADPNYTVYGYVGGGIAAPFDAEGKKLIEKHTPEYGGMIFHGQVVKAANEVGYEVRILHLLGRSKKTANYDVFYGDEKQVRKLDGNAPPEARPK
jgi:hypothetical protein